MSATPRDELERQLAAHRAAVARLEERLGAAAAPAAAAPVVTPRLAEAPAPAEAYTQRDAPPWLLVPGPKTLPALAEPRGRPLRAEGSCRPGVVFIGKWRGGQEKQDFIGLIRHCCQDEIEETLPKIAAAIVHGGYDANGLYLGGGPTTSPLGEAILRAYNGGRKTGEALVRALLRMGADPNLLDHCGQRPLHLCVYEGQPSLAAILLDAGADPELPQLAHIDGRWRYDDTPRRLAARPRGEIDKNLEEDDWRELQRVLARSGPCRAPLAMLEPRDEDAWRTGVAGETSLTNDARGDRPTSAEQRQERIRAVNELMSHL